MKVEKFPKPLLHENHPRPRTRRQFLGQGLISGAGMLMAPSLLGFLGRSSPAYAQAIDCDAIVGGGKIPFITIDLAGGASVAGSNVLTGGPLGQEDFLSTSGYELLGLPSDETPDRAGQLDRQLGLAFHSDSAFLRGIIDKTSQATRDNVNGSVICARSDNDTGNNPHNPMYGVARAGAAGRLVTLCGTENSESGGNSLAPMMMLDPALRPTKIDRPSDVTGLVDTGKLVELLSPGDAGSVMSTVEQISAMKLSKTNEEQVVQNLIQAAYTETTEQVACFGDPAQLDPLQDANIASIFNANDLNNDKFRKTAAIMKMVVQGFAGAGTLEFGGYDYHDSTRATGEVRDFEAGQAMGACLEYARLSNQPLMLYVFSDGSVASDGTPDNSGQGRGKLIWKGDNSSTASVFMLVFDPTGPPAVRRQQVGYFRPGGTVELGATRVANDVNRLAEAIVLNYMALHGEEGMFGNLFPDHGLGSGQEFDDLIALDNIT